MMEYLLQDDVEEFECKDTPVPIISQELEQRMNEIAEDMLFGDSADTRAA